MSHNDKVLINGPLNAIRIEGNIGSIKKVLYLFGDIHYDLGKQNECSDIYAQRIDTYILEQFNKRKAKKDDQKLDLFVEICHDQMVGNKNYMTYNNIYLNNVRKLFVNQFITKGNKTLPALNYNDVRLHYMDIRCYFPKKITYSIATMSEETSKYQSLKNKVDINLKFLDIIKEECSKFLKILKNPKKTKTNLEIDATNEYINMSELTEGQRLDVIQNIVYKIKNVHKNQHIGKIIKKIFDKYVTEEYENFIKYIKETEKEFIKLIPQIQKLSYGLINKDNKELLFTYSSYGHDDEKVQKIQKELSTRVNKISAYELHLNVILTDMYMIRRFLDKEYITNSVSYTGISHMTDMVYMLLKYFDFKITHIAKTNGEDNNTLKKMITNVDHPYIAERYIMPYYDDQCIDISDFPIEFN